MRHASVELAHADPASRRRITWITVTATVVGALLRSWDLGRQPLWLDEQASFEFTQRPFWWCVYAEAQHPPLYRALLWHSVRWIGDSDALVRVLSVIFGTATVGVGCLLTARLRTAALPRVAFLLVVSPFLFYYSRENRNYALVILLSLWSTLAFVKVLRQGRGLVVYGLLTVLLAYTHYFGAFVVLAHEWAFWRSRSRLGPEVRTGWRSWLLMRGVSAILVMPWTLWLLQNLEMKPRGWLLDPFSAGAKMFARMVAGYGLTSWPKGRGLDLSDPGFLVELVVLGSVVVPAACLMWRGLHRLGDDPLAVGAFRTVVVLPFAVLVPVSIQARFISERYLAFLAPFLLIAYGIGWSLQQTRRRVLDAVVVGTMLFALASHVFAPGDLLGFPLRFRKEPWPEAARYAEEFAPDKVLYCHDYIRPVFNRYFVLSDGDEREMPVDRLCLVLSHQSAEEEAELRARFEPGYVVSGEKLFTADTDIRVILFERR